MRLLTTLTAIAAALASGCHDSDSDHDSVGSVAGSVQFSSATFTVNEGVGTATITLTRTGGGSGPITVVCLAGGGTASPGADYPQFFDYVQEVTWADGDVSPKTFDFPILDDAGIEGPESLDLILSETFTGSGPLGTPSTAVLTILDND